MSHFRQFLGATGTSPTSLCRKNVVPVSVSTPGAFYSVLPNLHPSRFWDVQSSKFKAQGSRVPIRHSSIVVFVLFLSSILYILPSAARAQGSSTNTAIALIQQTFADLHTRFGSDPTNTVLAWQFGRACYDMSDLQKDSGPKAAFAEQGITACQISLRSNSVQAHYYLGMNIGQLADARHNLSALHLAKDIEREFLAARALDEQFDDAGPDRGLGLLYRETPTIISIGSRTKARQHLERAAKLAPGFPENRLNLLESYLKWGYRNDAARELKQVEEVWPAAVNKYTGEEWALSWPDWTKRLAAAQKRLVEPGKTIESPHDTSQEGETPSSSSAKHPIR